MKTWKKGNGLKFSNSKVCYGETFFTNDPNINLAVITIKSRYPEKGYAYNIEAYEMAYVASGKGSIEVLGKDSIELNVGDVVYLEPMEKIAWNGDMVLIVPCAPAFDPKKHLIEEESLKQFTIEKPTVDDVAGIGEAQLQSWKETYPNEELGITEEWIQKNVGHLVEERGHEFRKKSILESLKPNSNSLYLVVKDNEKKIKGFLHVTQKTPTAYFDAIYLTKDAQGTGVAHSLMKRALEFLGDAPIEVRVASYNKRAINFYEQYGFKITGQLDELHKGKMPITVMMREDIS